MFNLLSNKVSSKEVNTMKNNNKKKKKGFTLIELIAVIAILGVLAAIAVPNIQGYTNKAKIAKVKADAKVVLGVVTTAQAESSNPSAITNYTTAVAAATGDTSLALTKAPDADLASATVDTLNTLISSTSTDFDTTYKTYYAQ